VSPLPQHRSASNEHGTPPEIIEAARATLGGIDLDPASDAVFNRAVRATRWFGMEHNGLAQVWRGRVFLNPPGGVDEATRDSRQAAWWWSLAERWKRGTVEAAIFVGFSIEILQVAQDRGGLPEPLEFPFCVPRSRPKYRKQVVNADGKTELVPQKSPPHAGVVVFLPPKCGSTSLLFQWERRFVRAFSPIGRCANLETDAFLEMP